MQAVAVILGVFLVIGPTCGSWSQEPGQKEAEPDVKYEFFSGNVVSIDDSQITVERSLPDRDAESHSFVLNTETIVEGKLRVNTRVTVGYMQGDDGDVALRIIVRGESAR